MDIVRIIQNLEHEGSHEFLFILAILFSKRFGIFNGVLFIRQNFEEILRLQQALLNKMIDLSINGFL